MENLMSIQEHSDYLSASTYTSEERWEKHRLRVVFGKQKLKLWMFVPCKLVNGAWVVLKEPKDWRNWEDVYIANITEGRTKDRYTSQLQTRRDCLEYQKANERVLFQNFEYPENAFLTNGNLTIDLETMSNMIVEDLVKYNVKLTPLAQKQLS